jgi:hypothetical protein
MDIRHIVLRHTRGPRLGDGFPFRDDVGTPNKQRPEMRQRRLVTVAGGDRHGQAVSRELSGKRDLARCRSSYDPRLAEGDVDATMLPACVRVVAE